MFHFNLPKIALTSLMLFMVAATNAAEFTIMNQNVTLTSSSCGFYFVMSPTNGPVSWYSPDNYVNGQVYFRFEVINQPTNTPCYFSFDIWGDHSGSYYTESASSISSALNGPGSVSIFNSSPSTWWPNSNGPVNFSNRNTFWRWGIVHWFSKSPNYLLAPLHWSDDPESWAAWEHNGDWLPITVKVTIVAVSQGSTFSGWSNYITPSTKQPTPTYGIDYAALTTNKVVSAGDIFSYNADMSGAAFGTGHKLSLLPGQNVYFQTPAGGGLEASDIQTLTVPARPAAPSYTVDFVNEITAQNIPNTVEYSFSNTFSSSTTANGSKVALTPGQNLYFRVKSTASGFASNSFLLDVPSRQALPSAISINYSNETTGSVPASVEYSTSAAFTTAQTGAGVGIIVTPGTDVYFRTKATASAFKSDAITLDVPSRPAAPAISIDFPAEVTSAVPASIEYSTNPSLTGSSSGTNSVITVTPGTTLYFRTKATASDFKSEIQTLNVTERPVTPSVTINYSTELTSVIPSIMEYSTDPAFSGALTGNNTGKSVIPGTNLYFRTKATASQFKSGIQALVVPNRPVAPAITFDYHSEMTSAVPASVEYSLNQNMTSSNSGTNVSLNALPGSTLYLRVKATESSFNSAVQTLNFPARPATPTVTIDYVNELTSPITADMEYATEPSMAVVMAGADASIPVIPGFNLYVRKAATNSQFKSAIQTLIIPERPTTPSFGINYANESTDAPLSEVHEFSLNNNLEDAVSGSNAAVSLIPGTMLYIRKKVTDNQFASEIQELFSPFRPLADSFHLDYLNERTSEEITPAYEYSSSSDMTDLQYGTDTHVTLIPGLDLFIRLRHTDASFDGDTFHLVVPERPVIESSANDTVSTPFFTVNVNFHGSNSGFDTTDIVLTNAKAELIAANTLKLIPEVTGDVTLKIKADAIQGGNFASEEYKIYYKKAISGIEYFFTGTLFIYPSPVTTSLKIEASEKVLYPVNLKLLDNQGKLIYSDIMTSGQKILDMSSYNSGLYILKITDSNGNTINHKIIKK